MKKKVFVSGCYDLLHSGHVDTSTRKMIQKIWPVKLSKMDPEILARLVFCFENNPERHDGIISGARSGASLL